MRDQRYPAQILLITILVLMIVSIVVVGVVGLANRDIQQSVSEQQYQQILNTGESQVLTFVENYSFKPISDIITEEPVCNVLSSTELECPLGLDENDVESVMRIEETAELDDFELIKDQSVEVDLLSDPSTGKGFRGKINFDFTSRNAVALEFTMIYLDQLNQAQVVSDIFDITGGSILNVSQGNPLSGSTNHPFNFAAEPDGTYSFIINNIDGLTATDLPRVLRITARMTPAQELTLLDVRGTLSGTGLNNNTGGIFPTQVRVYTALSYFGGQDTNISATVAAQVPLTPQTPAFLYTGLMTNDTISK